MLSIGRTSRSLRRSLSARCMGAFCILRPLLLFPVALVGRCCPGAASLGQARVPSLPLRRCPLPRCSAVLSWIQVPHPVCGAGRRLALGWSGRLGSAQARLPGSSLAFQSDTGLLCSRSRTSCSGMAKMRTAEGIPFLIAICSERGHQLQWTCEAQGVGSYKSEVAEPAGGGDSIHTRWPGSQPPLWSPASLLPLYIQAFSDHILTVGRGSGCGWAGCTLRKCGEHHPHRSPCDCIDLLVGGG